jgi:hypothetical protein
MYSSDRRRSTRILIAGRLVKSNPYPTQTHRHPCRCQLRPQARPQARLQARLQTRMQHPQATQQHPLGPQQNASI